MDGEPSGFRWNILSGHHHHLMQSGPGRCSLVIQIGKRWSLCVKEWIRSMVVEKYFEELEELNTSLLSQL